MSNGSDFPVQPAQKTQFPYLNRAVVDVEGTLYYEWESVSVRAALWENTRTFRLTTSERENPPQSGAAHRLVPGMKCDVYLDGLPALTNGEIITRQVFYDAHQHTIEIQGQGPAGRMADASVISQTHEWKNLDLRQLWQTLAAPFGVSVVGTPWQNMTFPRVSATPGESNWELGERHTRATSTPISENAQGQIQLGYGQGQGSVIEGWNILEGREVIHSLKSVGGGDNPVGTAPGGGGDDKDYTSMGQKPGTDDEWGAQVNQQQGEKPASIPEFSPQGGLGKVQNSEIPAWTQDQMKNRSGMEAMFDGTLQVWVTVTLLTWQRSGKVPPSGGLWEPGDNVMINSPMLVMYGEALVLNAVTFTQDNTTGTRATIELVNQKAMSNAGQTQGVPPGSGAPQQPLTPNEGAPDNPAPGRLRSRRR